MRRALRAGLLFALSSLALMVGCAGFPGGADGGAASPREKIEMPLRGVCAHRGASYTHPENTLAAFREAVRLGAHMIEFDVAVTKDKALVVLHDAKVDRTTDGKGELSTLTLAEIKGLDAGSWVSSAFRGERIPTLGETLDSMPVNTWLNIHVKGGEEVVAQAARMIVMKERLHQAFLTCEGGAEKGAQRVDSRLMICLAQNVRDPPKLRSQFVQITGGITDRLPGLVREMKAHGIRVTYYATDFRYELRSLFEAGVDFPLVNNVAEMLMEAERLGIARWKPRW